MNGGCRKLKEKKEKKRKKRKKSVVVRSRTRDIPLQNLVRSESPVSTRRRPFVSWFCTLLIAPSYLLMTTCYSEDSSIKKTFCRFTPGWPILVPEAKKHYRYWLFFWFKKFVLAAWISISGEKLFEIWAVSRTFFEIWLIYRIKTQFVIFIFFNLFIFIFKKNNFFLSKYCFWNKL